MQTPVTPDEERNYTVRAIDRAFDVLELVATQPGRISDISARLGLHKTTTLRILANLQDRGYLQRDAETGRYSITFKLFQLGLGGLNGKYSPDIVRPVLSELALESGESSQFCVRDGDEVVCVDQCEGHAGVRMVTSLGRRFPLTTSSVGKVVLAFLSVEEIEAVLRRPLPRPTPYSVASVDELRQQLAEIRSTGFASSPNAISVGATGIAAPVRNAWGGVFASVSVLAPTERATDPDRVRQLGAMVVKAAQSLSSTLGADSARSVAP